MTGRFIWIVLLMGIYQCSFSQVDSVQKFSINGHAQGTTFHITYFSLKNPVAPEQIDSIFRSLDSSLSLYKSWSLVNRFNQSAHGISLDEHLRAVVLKGMEAFRETKGVFDITIYPITDIWGFGLSKVKSIPSSSLINAKMNCVGTHYLQWERDRLIKTKSCVAIDPNGIAQGYSCDVVAAFLEMQGVQNYLVEIGGEMRVKGRRPDGNPMRIAIETPGEDPWDISLNQKIIAPGDGAITSSGNYRKFRESGGKKLSHILDARTGRPAVNELVSVTVFARDALTADAYDNALMAMGLKKALAFCESHPAIAAYFIYKKKDGSIAGIASQRFPPFVEE